MVKEVSWIVIDDGVAGRVHQLSHRHILMNMSTLGCVVVFFCRSQPGDGVPGWGVLPGY